MQRGEKESAKKELSKKPEIKKSFKHPPQKQQGKRKRDGDPGCQDLYALFEKTTSFVPFAENIGLSRKACTANSPLDYFFGTITEQKKL